MGRSKFFVVLSIVAILSIATAFYFVVNTKKDLVSYNFYKTDCYFNDKKITPRYVISSFLGSDEIIHSLMDIYNRNQDRDDKYENKNKYKIKYSYLAKNSLYSNISEYISDKDIFLSNIESIIVERPDLVFSSYYNDLNYINNLFYMKQRNCILTRFITVDDILFNISFISSILELKKEGDMLIKDIKEEIKKLESKFKSIDKKEKTILIYMDKGFSIGNGTVINDFLNVIGFTNVMNKKTGFFKINEEEILDLNPSYVLVIINQKFDEKKFKSSIKKSIIKDLEAVKEEKYIFLKESIAFSVSNYIKDIATSFYNIKN